MLGGIRKFWALLLIAFSMVLHAQNSDPGSNQSPEKKILVLIIASDNHPAFLSLQKIWQSYMHLDPEHVEAYFIKGDPNLDAPYAIAGDTLYSKMEDNYQPGILKKTLLSMEYFEDKLDSYDYVLRTNLSSFYVFPRLLEYAKSLPATNCYCAMPLIPSFNVPPEYNVPFGWGAGFLISPDIVKLLIHHQEEVLQHGADIPDDVLIGAFLHRNNVGIIPVACCKYLNRDEWIAKKDQIPENAFHFRAKSHYNFRTMEDAYADELYILTELIHRFYPSAVANLPSLLPFRESQTVDVQLSTLYDHHAILPSDINEHLPLLRELSSRCMAVTEIGMRPMNTTWAILKGLSESRQACRTYVGIDPTSPPAEKLADAKRIAEAKGIGFQYIQENDLKAILAPTDLLFIDFYHTYPHVTYELETFSPYVRKYIALHDTSDPWGNANDWDYRGDYSEYPAEIDRTKKGVWPAIEDFLQKHPEWKLKERRTNNHGFTILERV